MTALEPFGWNNQIAESWQALDAPGCVPARVVADFGAIVTVALPEPRNADLSGRLVYDSAPDALPKVGDWVAVRLIDGGAAVVEAVLPRLSEIARKVAGRRVQRQVMAANVDIAFIVQALDADFSPERMQRYLYQLSAGQVRPVLVLNKADQVEDIGPYIEKIEDLNLEYVVCSAKTGVGLEAVAAAVPAGATAVFLGSSGVGKSTLTNRLLGEERQATAEVRASDAKGRHTTTHRELFTLPGGGLLIDTPGVRELQLWGTGAELDAAFADIALLAASCQFGDCRHETEPSCAVKAAIETGELDPVHLENYLKMKRELEYLATKTDPEALRSKKRAISKAIKQHYAELKDHPKHGQV